MMTQLPNSIRNAIRILGLACLVSVVPAAHARAQVFGYGGYGGYPGYGYGYAVPGVGIGAPGLGFGYGYGFPPGGYYGYGGAVGFGGGLGFAYPPTSYGYFGNAYPPGLLPPLVSGVGDTNPLMGVGLTPLGVQSALAEGALRRGAQPPVAGAVRPGAVNSAPGAFQPTPPPNPGNAASQYSGTGSARPR